MPPQVSTNLRIYQDLIWFEKNFASIFWRTSFLNSWTLVEDYCNVSRLDLARILVSTLEEEWWCQARHRARCFHQHLCSSQRDPSQLTNNYTLFFTIIVAALVWNIVGVSYARTPRPRTRRRRKRWRRSGSRRAPWRPPASCSPPTRQSGAGSSLCSHRYTVELETKAIRRFVIMEKAATIGPSPGWKRL